MQIVTDYAGVGRHYGNGLSVHHKYYTKGRFFDRFPYTGDAFHLMGRDGNTESTFFFN